MIRPPAPWGEPLGALAPALIYSDVDRKVGSVPKGSWIRTVEDFGVRVCMW